MRGCRNQGRAPWRGPWVVDPFPWRVCDERGCCLPGIVHSACCQLCKSRLKPGLTRNPPASGSSNGQTFCFRTFLLVPDSPPLGTGTWALAVSSGGPLSWGRRGPWETGGGTQKASDKPHMLTWFAWSPKEASSVSQNRGQHCSSMPPPVAPMESHPPSPGWSTFICCLLRGQNQSGYGKHQCAHGGGWGEVCPLTHHRPASGRRAV